MGGSMYIHAFGAYFGLTASYFFHPKRAIEDKEQRGVGGYTSQYVAMLGTIFLYLFWPSFNAALAPAISQQRVVVNTALSISASCICAAGIARIIHGKLEMEIMLNATLAGGVVIGACSDVVVSPGASIVIGGIGGIISALGFAFLSKALQRSIGLHDTCGVNNLHGMPGILGGIIGAVTSSMAGSVLKNKEAVGVIFSEVGAGRRTFE
jgi:ammonium transporter Rh